MGKYSKEPTKKTGRGVWIAVLVVSLLVLVGAVILLLPQLLSAPAHSSGVDEEALPTLTDAEPASAVPEETDAEETRSLAENPIDWAEYTELNEDVYAWIVIPGTGIDLPVLQAHGEMDDNFYLHHDINGNYLFAGEIYSQKANAKDFTDRVTVLYGHNMKREGERFTNLLYFEDETFFQEHEFFYIYTPDRVYTYRIASAHAYDTRHILNNFDFGKDEDFQEYLDTILSPRTVIANVREGVELTLDDHIVTLSTCTYVNNDKIRYLVQGVLVDEQPTE